MVKTVKYNVRRRILISSVILSVLFILIVSPFFSYVTSAFSNPKVSGMVRISKAQNQLEVSWELDNQSSLNRLLYLDLMNKEGGEVVSSASIEEEKKITYFSISEELLNSDMYLTVQVEDAFGKKSEKEGFEFTISESDGSSGIFSEILIEKEIGSDSESSELTKYSLIFGLVAIATLICVVWIFNLDVLYGRVFLLIIYTILSINSFLMLILLIIDSGLVLMDLGIFSFIVSIAFFIFVYLLFLMLNILYNSLFFELPLEQAAKASQFILTLIVSYFTIIIVYATNQSIGTKLLLIPSYIFAVAFSSIAMVRTKNIVSSFYNASAIALVTGITIFVVSMWPVNYVLGMIAVAVVFYIVLSLSLEVSQRISKSTWSEFVFLLFLVLMLFIYSSTWGINGPLL